MIGSQNPLRENQNSVANFWETRAPKNEEEEEEERVVKRIKPSCMVWFGLVWCCVIVASVYDSA